MSENTKRRPGSASRADMPQELQSGSIIEGTFDSFARRLKREQEAQRLKIADSEQQQKIRQKILLRAMTTIRRALSDTERVDLGSRFSFDLQVSDWQGWPRVELLLIDSVATNHRSHSFIVTASDSESLSYIRISDARDETIDRVQIVDESSLAKIPTVLKKTLRHFLDAVTMYVLDPLAPEELLEVQTRGIAVRDSWDVSEEGALGAVEVFSEDSWDASSNCAETSTDIEPIEVPLHLKN